MMPLNPFPLTQGLFEQVASYFRFFFQHGDLGVLTCALLFLLLGPIPAVLIDLARLPARTYDRWMTRRPAQRNHRLSG
jgi:hypothetical protein